jgi:undecaprenyl-diphosphatase
MSVARLARSWRTTWKTMRRPDATLLVALLLTVACLWAFVELADGVADRGLQPFDEALMQRLRAGAPDAPVGPRWLRGAMRDVTALGSAPVLIAFVLAVTGALVARRQRHAALLLLAATLGGRLLNAGLKALFARPRPSTLLHLVEVDSPSFPSGHAMDSAVIYFTLAALLASEVRPLALKLYFVVLAACLTLAVGVSRVYLGVHYPSDVLAGWTIGLAWALLCWIVARHLQRRGSVEASK